MKSQRNDGNFFTYVLIGMHHLRNKLIIHILRIILPTSQANWPETVLFCQLRYRYIRSFAIRITVFLTYHSIVRFHRALPRLLSRRSKVSLAMRTKGYRC